MRRILAILAGGRSSRFAGRKSHLRIEGQPVLRWMHSRWAHPEVFDEAWLNLAPDDPLPPGGDCFAHVVRDEHAYAGPLPGIAHLLARASPADHMLIAAVDMPLLSGAHLARLMRALHDVTQAAAVMSRWSDGPAAQQVEPLPSAWRAGPGAELVKQALERGLRGPSALAAATSVMCVDLHHATDAQTWHSVNTRADLDVLRQAGLRVEAP
jgi:molybdopterin-guanine dinucleotide biosynthesis protein A